MMISTKGRYALRVMIDLAQNRNGGYIPMKEVAARQEISLKYLERILPSLTKDKLVETVHGKGGGYRLTKDPIDYTVWEILRSAEGNMAPVECLGPEAVPCERASICKTLPLWRDFYEMTRTFFESRTLAEFLEDPDALNYII